MKRERAKERQRERGEGREDDDTYIREGRQARSSIVHKIQRIHSRQLRQHHADIHHVSSSSSSTSFRSLPFPFSLDHGSCSRASATSRVLLVMTLLPLRSFQVFEAHFSIHRRLAVLLIKAKKHSLRNITFRRRKEGGRPMSREGTNGRFQATSRTEGSAAPHRETTERRWRAEGKVDTSSASTRKRRKRKEYPGGSLPASSIWAPRWAAKTTEEWRTEQAEERTARAPLSAAVAVRIASLRRSSKPPRERGAEAEERVASSATIVLGGAHYRNSMDVQNQRLGDLNPLCSKLSVEPKERALQSESSHAREINASIVTKEARKWTKVTHIILKETVGEQTRCEKEYRSTRSAEEGKIARL